MAKIFSVVTRSRLSAVIDPVARALLRAGVSPNAVTVAGTAGVLAAALAFAARGRLVTAVAVITLCALLDIVDGAMARLRGGSSRFGALLDSAMDRLADGAIFGALAYWLASTGRFSAAAATLAGLVLGQLVSYVKARGEGLGLRADGGFAERFERLALLGLGALADGFGVPRALDVALWLLVALSALTVGQRLLRAHRSASQADTGADGAAQPGADGAAQRGAP